MPRETITKTVLSNGLQIKLRRQTNQRTINLGLFIRHGAVDEDLESNGIAHFIEHVIFNPTHMPEETQTLLNTLMDGGASYEAYTSNGLGCK